MMIAGLSGVARAWTEGCMISPIARAPGGGESGLD
jgi:hypothetical protein